MQPFLARCWDRWSAFWFTPKAPESLAIFRILLGVFFLVYWLLRAPHVEFLFSADGIYMPAITIRHSWSEVHDLFSLLGFLSAPIPVWATWSLYIGLIGSLLLFTIGLWTRGAAISTVVLYLYFYLIELYQLDASYDRLFLQTAFAMCFSDCDERFSVRAWRLRRRRIALREKVPFWPARLIGLQMMLVYFGTGFHKSLSPAWDGGEILYYSLISQWGSGIAYGIAGLLLPMAVYQVMVYGTIAFELFAPYGLYVPRFQPWYFASGVLFHVGIAVTLQIWQFVSMPAAYILFVDPERVRRWCDGESPSSPSLA